jgi:hypothetical protein
MDKHSFLQKMSQERSKWNALLTRVGENRMSLAGVEGSWALKDIVAHVSAYERGLVKWLEEAQEGRVAEFPILDHPDLDYRNEEIYRTSRDLTVQQVLDASEKVFVRLLDLVSNVPEQDLIDAARSEWFVRPRWKQARELWECIAHDSYRHYRQHIPGIEAWLEQQEDGVAD